MGQVLFGDPQELKHSKGMSYNLDQIKMYTVAAWG